MSTQQPDNSEPELSTDPLGEEGGIDETAPEATEQQAASQAPTEPTLPPEAQGETNGGPLGCCLGVMVGLLLSLSLAILSRLYADPLGVIVQNNYGLLGLIVRILMAVLACAFAIICGYFGWRLGKRFYREYEVPVRPTRKARKARQR